MALVSEKCEIKKGDNLEKENKESIENQFELPPKLQEKFGKDIEGILEVAEDRTDEIMLKASTDLSKFYFEKSLTAEQFKKMRTALKYVYAERKMKNSGKGPNEEFIKKIDDYMNRVETLVGRRLDNYIQ